MELDVVPCPRCRKQVKNRTEHFPFCSERCRFLDLGSWFAGDYRLSRPVLDPFGGLEEEGFEGSHLEEPS